MLSLLISLGWLLINIFIQPSFVGFLFGQDGFRYKNWVMSFYWKGQITKSDLVMSFRWRGQS